MGREVAGVDGLHSHVALAMEQEIADSLQSRWLRRSWSAREGTGKAPSPTALPFDLEKWWKPAGQSHSGHVDIVSFMKFITTKSFMPFVWYRIALGVVILVLVATGVLSPHAAESAH
ncbi:Undecaprenyl-diphosphatase [Streptomyces sp. AVP053U2]|nr:Undecaprenyl-diphosphatase [Streptomyces sp. AVP053U2]